MRAALIVTASFLSSPAWACAVCGGVGQNQQAFLETMVFMTMMPILMLSLLAGAVWWLVRRAAELEAEELAEQRVRESV